jgi:hypothetical protein
MYIESFKQHFSAIDDHRQSAKVTYPLFDILFGSLCAVIAGSNGWFEIREYILGHHSWFKKQKMFIDGIPADDTIARIVSMIDPDSFNGKRPVIYTLARLTCQGKRLLRSQSG